MESDNLILSTLYLIHMTASVLWCTGMLVIYLDNHAIARSTGMDGTRLNPIARKRLYLAAWFCLGLIGATGMFQMSASESYLGFMDFSNSWSQAILVKHLLVLVFLAAFLYLTAVMEPGLSRAVYRLQGGMESILPALQRSGRSENRLLIVIFALFFLVLVFTSLARAS